MSDARASSQPKPLFQKPTAGMLIDVVVLCFAKSELKSLVGTDALRSVLEGAQRDLFPSPDTLSLQPVYELLESQPGFDADKAVGPFCRIKQWEQQLRVTVEMPHQLAVLDRKTREDKALLSNAFDSDLEKILKPITPTVKEKAIEKPKDTGPITHASFNRRTKVALLCAVLGLGAAGVSFYFTFHKSSDTLSLQAKDLTADVPIKDVRFAGTVITAQLADPAWLAKPDSLRTTELLATAPKVRMQGATRLLIFNKGTIVATVFAVGAPKVILAAPPPPK